MAEALAVPIRRAVVRAAGPEAAAFLQGQLSQDVAALTTGESAWSLLLQPAGKVVAWLRTTRLADDAFALDTDEGFGPEVLERLERFKLRTKCDLTVADEPFVAVRGTAEPPATASALPIAWPMGEGFDVWGAGGPTFTPTGTIAGTVDDYERLRITAGVPAMGAELTERTIPAEVGPWFIARSVSFTKGCYTGQELLARIDSRGGNVPRRLRAVALDTAGVPVGSELRAGVGDGNSDGEGKVVGTITSVAGTHALAFVARAVTPPAQVAVRWADGETTGRVDVLPGG